MKRILEENTDVRIQHYCPECRTLFDYQDEDVEVEKTEWEEDDRWYGHIHWVRTKKFVTCPKCGKKIILSDKEYSR